MLFITLFFFSSESPTEIYKMIFSLSVKYVSNLCWFHIILSLPPLLTLLNVDVSNMRRWQTSRRTLEYKEIVYCRGLLYRCFAFFWTSRFLNHFSSITIQLPMSKKWLLLANNRKSAQFHGITDICHKFFIVSCQKTT